MRIYIRVLILLIILLTPLKGWAININTVLSHASKGGLYIQPDEEELKDAMRLMERLFNGKLDEEAKSLSSKIGFKIMEIDSSEGQLVILKEDDDKKRGRGLMIFRLQDYRGFAIEVPHAFTDIHTRKIGLKLFLDGMANAVIFNTVKRKYKMDGVSINADMAHIEESYFTAFARAFARTHPSGYIIQLHGFSKQKRSTPSGRKSDMIISSGRSMGSWASLRIYNCLRKRTDYRISIYPHDVKELGGRTNSVARLLNSMGYNGFVHLEMSGVMRNMLIKDERLYKEFVKCIIKD